MRFLWLVLTVGVLEFYKSDITALCGSLGVRSSDDAINERIIRGHRTTARQFPFFASMTASKGPSTGRAVCGGSLITRRHVLTAAHCVYGVGYPDVTIYVFVGNTEKRRTFEMVGEQTIWVKRAINHVRYSRPRRLDHDIAILELEHPVNLTDTVQTIQLSDEDFDGDVYTSDDCHLVGYGLTGSFRDPDFTVTGYRTTTSLRTTKVTVEPNYVCNYIMSHSVYWNYSMRKFHLCRATVGGNASCRGDSGSPVVCKDRKGVFRQVGIVSYGSNRYCSIGISGSTRVSYYRSWIANNLA